MRILDLNAYGVEEMNEQEISSTEGGFWGALLGAIAFQVAMECIEGSFFDSISSGREAGRAFFGI